jgi:hypothetical protein
MDQMIRSIFLFLALKELLARAVDNELTAVHGADAIASSTVTKYLRQRQFTSILVDPPEEPVIIVIDQAIIDALEHCPFSSIQEPACFTCIQIAPVRRHLTQSLDFVVKHLHWDPHTPTPPQKRSVRLSQLSSSSLPSNTLVGSSLSPLTSHDSIFLQTMSRSGFA